MSRSILLSCMFGFLGLIGAWALSPSEAVNQAIRVFSGMLAFSSSLAGWNISSLTQIRSQLKDLRYSLKLEHEFKNLGKQRMGLMWRWMSIIFCSSIVILISINTTAQECKTAWFFLSCTLLTVAIGNTIILLWKTVSLAKDAIKLDDFIFEEKRKEQ